MLHGARTLFETPMDRPIDIFRIIEEAGIWLMFQPMPRTIRCHKHENDSAGIILNSNHLAESQAIYGRA